MRRQTAGDLEFDKYFEKIIKNKHLDTRHVLANLSEDLAALCRSYDESMSALNMPKQKAWGDEDRTALLSCYNVVTDGLSSLKDQLINALTAESTTNIERCPYCTLNDPRTWDHYLPKNAFPEYSAYHANLVYICFSCNQRKHAHYHPDRLIFCHPYFTVDSENAMLHCIASLKGGRLAFRFYGAGTGADERKGRIFEEHISRLGLDQRFRAEAASLVGELIGELRQYCPEGVSSQSLKRTLERKYADARAKLGMNAWDSRFWHGLNACDGFVDYVNEKIRQHYGPHADGFELPAPRPA